MAHRSNRNPAAQAFLPFRRLTWITLSAGLGCLLMTGCDRTAVEQAFAPDPQLIEEQSTDSSNTAKPSSSTAPGGSKTPRLTGDGKPKTNIPSTGNETNGSTKPSGNGNNRQSLNSGDDGLQRDSSSNNNVANSDIDDIPAELESSVVDVLALGLLEPEGTAATDWIFQPNEPVTRGEFARWLLTVNNAVYRDRPAGQIRLARPNSTAAFKDVPTTHPEFAMIQGLAEAGIILSNLSGAQEQINFKPDEPLSREDMLLWKVPLDVREALPSSNIEVVQEAWGFQDASKVSGPALRAVLADYSNGDQAVIRRVFGYTTLLQPQKIVTQAEAAAALGYFGNGSQGISAGDL